MVFEKGVQKKALLASGKARREMPKRTKWTLPTHPWDFPLPCGGDKRRHIGRLFAKTETARRRLHAAPLSNSMKRAQSKLIGKWTLPLQNPKSSLPNPCMLDPKNERLGPPCPKNPILGIGRRENPAGIK
jgi:hypothetical protein